jgi:hypothetical protein
LCDDTTRILVDPLARLSDARGGRPTEEPRSARPCSLFSWPEALWLDAVRHSSRAALGSVDPGRHLAGVVGGVAEVTAIFVHVVQRLVDRFALHVDVIRPLDDVIDDRLGVVRDRDHVIQVTCTWSRTTCT